MEREDRIVTVPNLISVARLLCAPVFVWLLAADQEIAAALVLGVLGATDWVDGWIARHFAQGSALGKVLDPVADRVLLLVAAIALLADGAVPVVVGVLVLVREFVVSIAVLALAVAGARRIDVQWTGKAGTLSVMFALPLFLLADNIATGHSLVLAAAWLFAVVGLVLGYYALITYLPVARDALRDGRARAATPERVAS
jgi:cardiolipin synthase